MNEFEDIEQLLKPQCEFKASETRKSVRVALSSSGLGWLPPVSLASS